MKYRAMYRLIEFVRPGCFWPQPYTVEQAFGLFAHLVASAGEAPRGRNGYNPVAALLSAQPSCEHCTVTPIYSLEDLRQRFHFALLGHSSQHVERWRRRLRLKVGNSIPAAFPHHIWSKLPQSEHETKQTLVGLFGAQGKLTAQLNSCHAKAKEVYGVRLQLSMDYRWRFVLDYGFDGSVWYETIAEQGKREPFLLTLRRAAKTLETLKTNQAPSQVD